MTFHWPRLVPLTIGFLCLPGCHPVAGRDSVPVAPSAAVPVQTEPVRLRDVPQTVDAIGTVTPLRTVRLRPQVGGRLLSTPFKEGARVAKGQMLAVIDSRALQAHLKQARGNLMRDQALLKNAQTDLERERGAVRDGAATQQALDAQNALVAQYKGAVVTDQGLIEEIGVQIGYTRIRSPITGRIGLRQIDSGNLLAADDSSSIAVVTTLKPITVVFSVPEAQIPRIVDAWREHGLGVQAMDSEKRTVLDRGRLLAIDNRVDTQTGTVDLKAIFANDRGRLFPSQFVNARLTVGVLPGAMTVPSAAIRRGRGGDYLFTVDGEHRAQRHAVERGPEVAGYTVVRAADLHDTDPVVVEGADRLEDGTLVVPQPRPERPAEAAPTSAATANRGALLLANGTSSARANRASSRPSGTDTTAGPDSGQDHEDVPVPERR